MKNTIVFPISMYLFVAFFLSIASWAQNQNCTATTIEQFYDCYGGASTFNTQSQQAISTFIQAEDAIASQNYAEAKAIIAQLFETYPIGDKSWRGSWQLVNGSNIGSPHGYYGLRMMDDIATYHLDKNDDPNPIKLHMSVVLIGCSEGIQPTTDEELDNGTGTFVTNTMDPKLSANNYRIVKQSYDLLTRYITAITHGRLVVEVQIIELPDFCLPIAVSTTKPRVAHKGIHPVWEVLEDQTYDSTDWWWIVYPSHVPDYPDFEDNSFITGGMGMDFKGGPVFISDDQWIVRKPLHRGGGDYSDIERRMYLPMWFQHEFFHHLYRLYPEYNLEINGHDWFNRDFWPSDFEGQYENDFYSESLHKRLQLDCEPLESKLITRFMDTDEPQLDLLSEDEFLGNYARDVVNNDWQAGKIIKENNKYYWKNNANVQWEIIPKITEGVWENAPDARYPGSKFAIQLYLDRDSNTYTPGVTGLKFNAGFLRKRYHMLFEDRVPFEIAIGHYTSPSATGQIIKESGTLFWKNDDGAQWALTPNAADASFLLHSDSPTPGEKFELIIQEEECDYKVVGFDYLGNRFQKSGTTTSLGTNLARNGKATQSSNHYDTLGSAQLAIDGNTSGVWKHLSVTHTTHEHRPWWQVKLDQDYSIGQIKIWNRTDCCSERLSNFDVFVYNQAGDLTYKETIEETPNSTIALDLQHVIGSRVRIKLKGSNPLSLAEVAIYEASTDSGPPIGRTIAFRKSGGDRLWVTAEKYNNDNQLLARGLGIDDWEMFTVEAHPYGGIALRSNATGQYVQVQGNHADRPIRATGKAMKTWEQFEWKDMGDQQMALQSVFTGKWLQANWHTDNAVLYPNGAAAKTWETFEYSLVNTGSKNAAIRSAFAIYPVPTNSELHISKNQNNAEGILEIVDLKGSVLLRKKITEHLTTVNLDTFESGMYIARFSDTDGSKQIIKIIKN